QTMLVAYPARPKIAGAIVVAGREPSTGNVVRDLDARLVSVEVAICRDLLLSVSAAECPGRRNPRSFRGSKREGQPGVVHQRIVVHDLVFGIRWNRCTQSQ